MSQIVQKALDLLRPHRPHRLYPLCFVSEETRSCSKKLFSYLEKDVEELTGPEIEDIKKCIEEARAEVFQVVNWDGFTLLQRAVIGNHLWIVKILLKKGCDFNAGICSLPLHLACSLGHVHVAQLLLTFGAKADTECSVCYPEMKHKLKTYPDQMVCLAYQPMYTPVQYALRGDHEPVLRLLLHHENSRQLVKTDYLLHESCKMGAQQCCKYLLQRYSEQMSQENTDGKTPLQISLIMDAESAMFLRDHGAEIKDTVFLTECGSTLHELYKCKVSLGLVKATKFALEHGFRSHINVRNQEGNTALYVLLRHVGRTVKSSIQADYDRELEECVRLLLVHGSNPNIINHCHTATPLPADYDRELEECVRLLLVHGSNPNIINHCGENALHSLLSDTSTRQLYVNRHGQVRRLKPVLQQICKVADTLLTHGADAGHRACPAFIPPLYYAIRIFDSLQADMFVVVRVALKQLLLLLCQDNCNMNASDSYGVTPALHLLTASYVMISKHVANANFCKTILPFVGEMLQQFLKCGLDANAALTYWTRRMDEAIESSYYKEVVLYVNLQVCPAEPQFFDSVRQLLVRLSQRGGDPSRLTFTPSYGAAYSVSSEKVPRDASLACLLTRSLYIHPAPSLPHILYVFDFFYYALSGAKLSELLDSVNHYVSTDFKATPLPEAARAHLEQLTRAPRSLKQLARVAIATHVEWRLSKKVAKLPLPKVLLHYCLKFES